MTNVSKSITMISIIYSMIIFLNYVSINAQEGGLCPCQFDYNPMAPGDTSCYGQVPLIAGVKEIELDAELEHRESNFSFNMIMEYACKQAGAYVQVYTTFDEAKDNVTGMHNYSLFYINTFAVFNPNATDSFECGYFEPVGSQRVIKGKCGALADKNRRVVTALCVAAPVEAKLSNQPAPDDDPDAIDREDLDPKAKYPLPIRVGRERCVCPCSFYYDSNFKCFRDVQRCIPINWSDDLITTCSTVGTVPATVAWVASIDKVPKQWPTENLFFIGEIPTTFPTNESVQDTQNCTYKISDDEFADPFPCDGARNNKDLEFWSVLCITYEIEKNKQEQCDSEAPLKEDGSDENEEDEGDPERKLDEPDCGAMALGHPEIRNAIVFIVFWIIGLLYFE